VYWINLAQGRDQWGGGSCESGNELSGSIKVGPFSTHCMLSSQEWLCSMELFIWNVSVTNKLRLFVSVIYFAKQVHSIHAVAVAVVIIHEYESAIP
jgi:hypothetical protein